MVVCFFSHFSFFEKMLSLFIYLYSLYVRVTFIFFMYAAARACGSAAFFAHRTECIKCVSYMFYFSIFGSIRRKTQTKNAKWRALKFSNNKPGPRRFSF